LIAVAPEARKKNDERRKPDRADLRAALDDEQRAFRRLEAVRSGRDETAIAASEADLQNARNRVLALRLKHRM
jgi:hypothetical protein